MDDTDIEKNGRLIVQSLEIEQVRRGLRDGSIVVDPVNKRQCESCREAAGRHEIPPYHDGCACIMRVVGDIPDCDCPDCIR